MHLELLLFIFASMAICVGCLVPARWLPPLRHDKWMHFLAFAGLSILAKLVADTPKELMLWLFGLLLAGLAIEILQNWVPGRKFCWRDMAANMAGISLIAVASCL
ncbi:MAG: VanZ family protein [Pseudomonadota bacterium]